MEAAVQEDIVTHASVTARPFLKKEGIKLLKSSREFF